MHNIYLHREKRDKDIYRDWGKREREREGWECDFNDAKPPSDSTILQIEAATQSGFPEGERGCEHTPNIYIYIYEKNKVYIRKNIYTYIWCFQLLPLKSLHHIDPTLPIPETLLRNCSRIILYDPTWSYPQKVPPFISTPNKWGKNGVFWKL